MIDLFFVAVISFAVGIIVGYTYEKDHGVE